MERRRGWKAKSVIRFMRSHGFVDPVKGVMSLARELIREAGITSYPIDPLEVGKLRGIQAIERVTMNHSGALIPIPPSGYVIRVNAAEPLSRQNFTACHEIGHTFFLSDGVSNRKHKTKLVFEETKEEEELCDRFAEELLMPHHLLESALLKHERSVCTLCDIARSFHVSISAAAIRLAHSGLWRCVAIAWRPEKVNNSVGVLRYLWSAKHVDSVCYIPASLTCKEGSSMFEAYKSGEPIGAFENLQLGTLNGRYYVESEWFGSYLLSLVFLNDRG